MNRDHSDSNYFTRRACEEQAAAQRALDPRAQHAHSDLAERYSQAAQKSATDGHDDENLEPHPAMPLLQPKFPILA